MTEDDETRLVVRRGQALVDLDGEEYPVRAGEEAFIGEGITVGQYRGDEVDTASAPPPEEPLGDAPPVVVSELREYGEWIDRADVRERLAAARGGGLVPLRIRPLGVDLPVRMDMGFRRAVGVVSVPVRVLADRPGLRLDLVSLQLLRLRQLRFRLAPVSAPQCLLPAGDRPVHSGGTERPLGAPAARRAVPPGRSSVEAMPVSRGGTVRSTADGSSSAGARIAASGGTTSAVHAERQAEIRKTRTAQPRPDTPQGASRDAGRPSVLRGRTGGKARRRGRRTGSFGSAATGPRRAKSGGWSGVRRLHPGDPRARAEGTSCGRNGGPAFRGISSRGRGAWNGRRLLPAAYPRHVRRCVRRCGSPSRGSIDRADRRPGRKERRGVVQERAPAGRSPDPEPRGQEIRGNRGGDDGDRGGDAVVTAAAVERRWRRGGGRGDYRGGGDRGGGGRGR